MNLEAKARELRLTVLDMCHKANVGHVTSCFSCVEILTALYYGNILCFDPSDPKWEGRDRFILSKGHAGPLLYAILADMGFFPREWLGTFCQEGGRLGSHVEHQIPGVEAISGSLGHGLGIGAGMALAAKMDSKDWRVFVLLSDGDCYEGSTWEAAMFAAHHQLNNLVAIVDRNRMTVTGFTEGLLRLEPLADKWVACGWIVYEAQGHDMEELQYWLQCALRQEADRPYVIIADTIKGKGVPFLENSPLAHGKVPQGEEYENATRCFL